MIKRYFCAKALLARASGRFDLAVLFEEYAICWRPIWGIEGSAVDLRVNDVSLDQANAAVEMMFLGAGLAEVQP